MIDDARYSDILSKVKISGSTVTLPEREFAGSVVYRGTNTITKTADIFIARPNGNNWVVFRFSGKKNEWHLHGEITRNPRSYLADYDKVKDVQQIEPKWLRPAATAAKAATCKCVDKPKKEGGFLMSLQKVFGRFGKCPVGDFAMSLTGQVAIKRKTGSFACLQDGGLVDIDTLALDIDAFYYLPVAANQVAVNDVVLVGQNGIGFVTAVDGDNISVYDVNNEVVSLIKPIRHFLMPHPFVTKVVSLFTMGGGEGGGPFGGNPLLLWLLMGKDKGKGDNKLMLMLLLSGALNGGQGQGANAFGNPMMLYFLLKDKDGDSDKLLPLMLMQGQGQNGANPLGNPMLLYMLMGKDGDNDKLLPLMLMGGLGGNGGAGAVNPMLMAMAMSGDGGMDDMLPLMLMSGCCGVPAAPAQGKAPRAKAA